jgi:hypothetical protein
MITILENAQTRNKSTVNFVDHKGKVIGFNPSPDGARLKFQLRGPSGKTVLTEADMSLSHYLRGLACHFGPGISFATGEDGERRAMIIPLVSDTPVAGRGLQKTELHIEGVGGEYYCEDIGLTNAEIDELFAEKEAIGARKISVDRRLFLLEERVAALEAELARLAAK